MRMLVLALATMIAGPCAAQSYEEVERESRTMTLGDYVAFGGLATMGPPQWSVNTFFGVWTGAGDARRRHWIIRRAVGNRDGQASLVWADSRTCPGVEPLLTSMEEIALARPDAPGLGREPANLELVLDGVLHRFWNSSAIAGDDEAAVGLEITGNVNSPPALWWAERSPALDPCWSEVTPA